jgi:hypothetical protein
MSQLQAIFPEEVYSETLGGVEFDVLDVEMKIGNRVAYQVYYATLMKGYALSFIITFGTEEEAELLREILESVSFQS